MKSTGKRNAVVILFLCLLALVSAGYAQRDSVSPFIGSNSVVAPTNLEANKCYDCHAKLENAKLSSPAAEWKEGEHYKNGITCERCHAAVVPAGRLSNYGEFGGSYRDDHVDIKLEADVKAPAAFPVEGAVGEYTYVIRKGLTKQQAIAVCARCHGLTNIDPANKNLESIFPKYKESVHGQSVMVGSAGNPGRVGKSEVSFAVTGASDAAVCTDCHETHANKKASDPASKVYKANLVNTCGNCHGKETLIEKYGLTNVIEGWEENMMFRRGMIGEMAAGRPIPSCPDCHGGGHAIVSKDNPASSISLQNRAKTCGQANCHPAFKEKAEFNVPIHITFPPDRKKYFWEWLTFRFMEGLLISVMAVFIVLFALDIPRKLEEKRKGGEHK